MRKRQGAGGGVLTFLKCFSAHSLFMQSNMYSRLETNPSLFSSPGYFWSKIFLARSLNSREPRYPRILIFFQRDLFYV